MKIYKRVLVLFLAVSTAVLVFDSCDKEPPVEGFDGTPLPENYGILEVDFKLPPYTAIQKGIRRVDLAVCRSMDEMYRGQFFHHTNVSDAKQDYQIFLPEGTFYYQAVITCTCGGDSCIMGGFPYGYGGMKYAFDKVEIIEGQITRSQPVFQ
jgi:hypothetical protein